MPEKPFHAFLSYPNELPINGLVENAGQCGLKNVNEGFA